MRVLPARLARLTRDFAIIFVRESFLAAAATIAAVTSAVAAAIAAAAASVPAAAPAAAAWAARTAAGFRFRARFVHFQIAAADVLAVQGRDGLGRFGVVGPFHKAEATRAAGLAIGGDVHACELPERLKERAQIVRGGLKAHVAHKKIFHCDSLLSKPQPPLRQKPSARPKQQQLSCQKRKKDRAMPGRQTRSGRRARTAKLEERKSYSSMIVESCRGDPTRQ